MLKIEIATTVLFLFPLSQFVLSGHVSHTEMAMTKTEICEFLRDHAIKKSEKDTLLKDYAYASKFMLNLMKVMNKQ